VSHSSSSLGVKTPTISIAPFGCVTYLTGIIFFFDYKQNFILGILTSFLVEALVVVGPQASPMFDDSQKEI